eukprot:76020_1
MIIWNPNIMWITRVGNFVALIISLIILFRNHINKSKSPTLTPKSYYYLNLWSVVTLISTSIATFIKIFNKVPFVCNYTMLLAPACFLYPKVFLTYFQLTRLQHASHKSPNFFQYPIHIIYIFYFIGGIILFSTSVFPIVIAQMTILVVELPNNLGCIISKTNKIFTIISNVILVMYCIWDYIIVLLYAYKLHQLAKLVSTNSTSCQSMDNLMFLHGVFRKILFLTIAFEIFIVVITVLFLWCEFNWGIALSLDQLMGALVIYFMLEHNEESYNKLMKCLYSFKNCKRKKQTDTIELAKAMSNIMNVNSKSNNKESTTPQNVPVLKRDTIVKKQITVHI